MRKSADGNNGSRFGDFAAWTAASMAPAGVNLALTYPVLRDLKRKKGVGAFSLDRGEYPYNGKPLTDEAGKVVEGIKVEGVPIREYLRSRGINLYANTTFGRVGSPFFIDREGTEALKKAILFGPDLSRGIDKNLYRGSILLGFRNGANPNNIKGIAGHELGHAMRSLTGKARPKWCKGSKIGTMIGATLAPIRTAQGDVSGEEAAAWTAGNALMAAPMLHEEIAASRLGSKLVGLKGLSRLRSFRGVPTYAAMAAAPGIAWGARQLIDKIRGVKKTAEDYSTDAPSGYPDVGGNRGIGNSRLEGVGKATTIGTMATFGAGLGSRRFNAFMRRFGLRGIRNKRLGAGGGILAGIIANLTGKAKASMTRGRSAGDQLGYDSRFRWSNIFAPGAGAYNAAKRREREQLSRWHG